jgi:hypothetical protein
MNQKHLLRFIKKKVKSCPQEKVLERNGKSLTLEEVRLIVFLIRQVAQQGQRVKMAQYSFQKIQVYNCLTSVNFVRLGFMQLIIGCSHIIVFLL